jgi:hypothetical protein
MLAEAPEGLADRGNSDQGERVSKADQSDCGAVDAKGAVEVILSAAFRHFLGGKVIGSTGRLADATG